MYYEYNHMYTYTALDLQYKKRCLDYGYAPTNSAFPAPNLKFKPHVQISKGLSPNFGVWLEAQFMPLTILYQKEDYDRIFCQT